MPRRRPEDRNDPRPRVPGGRPRRLPTGRAGSAERRLLQLLFQRLQLPPLLEPPPFPDPRTANAEGLVGFTAAIEPEQVLAAYRAGIFPMADPSGLIGWWSPDPRAVLELDRVHVPRRLQRTARGARFEVRLDTACADVMAACADREETWISPELAAVYLELHRRGVVHSVETWRSGQLVGGLYGVSVGGAFMAESMFHKETDAGKVAVVALIERLRARGYLLLDIQQQTGATSIFRPTLLRRDEYLRRLAPAVAETRAFAEAA